MFFDLLDSALEWLCMGLFLLLCSFIVVVFGWVSFVVTYAHYAFVAHSGDAMADAWEDTAGCAQAICLHENLLK